MTGNRLVGEWHEFFTIFEVPENHNGSLERARACGVQTLSTPFDETAADFL